MFSIFKKKLPPPVDLSAIKTDIHSHLLPGIDDGSPNAEISIQLIKGLEDLGLQKFIATPHILQGVHNNNFQTISGAHTVLTQACNEAEKSVEISYAAEYLMDDYFEGLLQSKEPLLTLVDNKVLCEFSFVAPPYNYKEMLFDLQMSGYQPVLAHPERYLYFANQKNIFEELKHAGCLFQLNLLSLAGYYGKPTMDLAAYLIKQDWIDFVGTDMHHFRHLDALRHANHMMPVLNELMQSGRLGNAFM